MQCKGALLHHVAAEAAQPSHAALGPPLSPLQNSAFRRSADPDSGLHTQHAQHTLSPLPGPNRSTLTPAFPDVNPSTSTQSLATAAPMDLWPLASSDPLMSRQVADTGQPILGADSLLPQSRHQPMAHAYQSVPGGQGSIKRDVNGNVLRGPVASPNTKAMLLPTNRHKVYPMAPDRFVQPLPTDFPSPPPPPPGDFPCAPPLPLPPRHSEVAVP